MIEASSNPDKLPVAGEAGWVGSPMFILTTLNYILSSISIVSALGVLVIMGLIRLYNKNLIDRTSLRLCAAISVVDILRGFAMMVLYLQFNEEGAACQLSAVFIHFVLLAHIMLTVAIALNLQLIMLHRMVKKWWWEPMYWFIGVGHPLIITIVLQVCGIFGPDPVSGICFYRLTTSEAPHLPHLTVWAGFQFWNFFCPIYCLIVAVLVIIAVHKRSKDFKDLSLPTVPSSVLRNSSNNAKVPHSTYQRRIKVTKDNLSLLVNRICMYCLIPIITQSGCVLGLFFEEITMECPFWASVWDVVCTNLSGLLNLVGFFFDPALMSALAVIGVELSEALKDPETFVTRANISPSKLKKEGSKFSALFRLKIRTKVSVEEGTQLSRVEQIKTAVRGFQYHSSPWVCNLFKFILIKVNDDNPGQVLCSSCKGDLDQKPKFDLREAFSTSLQLPHLKFDDNEKLGLDFSQFYENPTNTNHVTDQTEIVTEIKTHQVETNEKKFGGLNQQSDLDDADYFEYVKDL